MPSAPTKTLLALLFIGVLMGALDIAIIGPALPAIQAEFGMDTRQLSVLFNAYVLCQMIGTQLLAKLADRFGPRAIYIFSISAFAAGSLLLVVSVEVWMLYLGRAIQGFGAGGVFPVATAIIATQLPAKERGPALGILGAVFGIAFFIGPILGGIFLRFSWHWLFLINLPIAALLIVGALRLVPASSGRRRQPFDFAGAAALSVGLTALVLAVNNLDTSAMLASLTSPAVWPLLLLVVILVPAFWQIEQRAADPVVRPALFASRQIVVACIVAVGVGAMQTAGVFYPALAIGAIGVSPSDAALLLLPGVLVSTIAAPVAGKLINSIGTRAVIVPSLLIGLLSFLIFGASELNLSTFIIANMLSGLSMAGLLGAPLRFILLTESGPADRAAAQGLLSVVMSVGRLLGAASVGAVAASRGGGVPGYQAAFIGMAILSVLLMVIAMALKSSTAEQAAVEREAKGSAA